MNGTKYDGLLALRRKQLEKNKTTEFFFRQIKWLIRNQNRFNDKSTISSVIKLDSFSQQSTKSRTKVVSIRLRNTSFHSNINQLAAIIIHYRFHPTCELHKSLKRLSKNNLFSAVINCKIEVINKPLNWTLIGNKQLFIAGTLAILRIKISSTTWLAEEKLVCVDKTIHTNKKGIW